MENSKLSVGSKMYLLQSLFLRRKTSICVVLMFEVVLGTRFWRFLKKGKNMVRDVMNEK